MEAITTDLSHNPYRPLQYAYTNAGARAANGTDTSGTAKKAFTQTNPNALNTNKPSRSDAFGISPESGLVSFIHDGGATDITFTAYFWCEVWNRLTAGVTPWVEVAESTALNSKLCRQNANATFKIPRGIPYFIRAGAEAAAPVNCAVYDGGPEQSNMNTNEKFK